MANELRLHQNLLGGRITDAPLTSGATSFNSAALATMLAVGSSSHLMVVLDPDGMGGAPEIVKVTAHTAAATSATIARGQAGTSARAHAAGTDWVASPPLASDMRASRKTIWAGAGSDLSTSTTSYVDIDATNLPALPLYLEVGETAELMLQGTFGRSASGVILALDWLVDRPASADTNLRGSLYGVSLWEPSSSSLDAQTLQAFGLFEATEAGEHTFKPQWKVSTGTAYLRFTGTYNSPVFHRVTKIGPA